MNLPTIIIEDPLAKFFFKEITRPSPIKDLLLKIRLADPPKCLTRKQQTRPLLVCVVPNCKYIPYDSYGMYLQLGPLKSNFFRRYNSIYWAQESLSHIDKISRRTAQSIHTIWRSLMFKNRLQNQIYRLQNQIFHQVAALAKP